MKYHLPASIQNIFHRRFRLLILVIVVASLSSTLLNSVSALAQSDPMPPTSAYCALSDSRLSCYDLTGARKIISDEGAIVSDFAMAPDGEWVAYRIDQQMYVQGIDRATQTVIDPLAALPSDFQVDLQTVSWSPVGNSLAYVIADGVRLAFPTRDGKTGTVDLKRNLYVNLRYSPDGLFLAVQSADENWDIFGILVDAADNLVPQFVRSFPVGDLTWADAQSIIFAPEQGGLQRVDVRAGTDAPPVWSAIDGRYTKLTTRITDGQVLAYVLTTAEGYGRIAAIGADGQINAFSDNFLDTRLSWIAGGTLMVYVTSGTAILVDPKTGYENTLPALKNVSQVRFGAPPIEKIPTLALDADLYYLSRDVRSVRQVWRILRNGGDLPMPVTTLNTDTDAFAVSPNKNRIAVISAGQLTVFPLPSVLRAQATPTPNRFSPTPTAEPPPPILAAGLAGDHLDVTWSTDATLLAYASNAGVIVVSVDGATAPRVVLPAGNYGSLQFSADHRYLLAEQFSGDTASTNRKLVVVIAEEATNSIAPFAPDRLTGEISTFVWTAQGLVVARKNPDNGLWEALRWRTDQAATQPAITPIQPEVIASSNWEITSLGTQDTADSLTYLRRANWQSAPDVLQLFIQPITAGAPAQVGSQVFTLSQGRLSPTARFAAGTQHWAGDPILGTLVILDLQTGRKIEIQNVTNLTDLRWVF